MNVLICPDSFKGCMTALIASTTIEKGIKNIMPQCECVIMPLADGGEGTKDVLVRAFGGENRFVSVCGPLFEDRVGEYGIIGDSIVIESASSCALPFVPKEKRNPLNTSTYGVGLTVKDALKSGRSHIILTVGGIATVDCGIGCLAALGAKFYDKTGKEVCPTGKGLGEIETIDDSDILPEAKNAKWTILCDVDNVLCGEKGAAYVFGPQKGADPETVKILDKNLNHFAQIIKNKYGKDILTMKHGGAAGGFPAGLCSFFDTEIVSGTDYILKLADFEKYVKEADIIVTGEGRVDSQTFGGKLISGIIKEAQNKPVIVIGGCVTEDGFALENENIKVYSASEGFTQEESKANPEYFLRRKTEEIFRSIK